ncbi:hypothetical protein ACQ86G_08785 [Roseateles chitinivorans]|uniref:hypothetical protein n=1 Tax=Roseateles chitinivorans TaxID=2917965 RepID=UPI003D67BC4A
MLTLGGSRPDFGWSPSGKLSDGAARMGTPRNRTTAFFATPSPASKSRFRLLVTSSQSRLPFPAAASAASCSPLSDTGQVEYVASSARMRWSPRKWIARALPLPPVAAKK